MCDSLALLGIKHENRVDIHSAAVDMHSDDLSWGSGPGAGLQMLVEDLPPTSLALSSRFLSCNFSIHLITFEDNSREMKERSS